MAKRKRNQQAAPADCQNAATPSSKKPKVVDETSQNTGPKETHASGESTVATPDAKRQSAGTSSTAPNAEVVEAPAPVQSSGSLKRERRRNRMRELKKGTSSTAPNAEVVEAPAPVQSSSSLKRERKRARLRELKKNALSVGKAKDEEPSKLPEQKHLPQEPPTTAVKNVPQSTAVLPEKKEKIESKARQAENNVNVNSSRKPTEAKKGQSSVVAPSSKKHHIVHSNKEAANRPTGAPTTKQPEGEQGKLRENVSKKQLRRQRASKARQAASLNGQQVATLAKANDETSSPAEPRALIPSAPKAEATSSDAALLHQTTKTRLLPRPAKQWVEQDDVEQDGSTTTSDASTSHEAGTSILDPLANALKASMVRSPPAQMKPTPVSKDTSAGSVDELPSFLATVGVPSTIRTPTAVSTPVTRPGINTIASFSLSSRRHPASILANKRLNSGLSGIRMDTGMIGSSPKPVSANKANSVPSYAGRGDVKAAFNRFNKFAHGGNSSGSDDDSEESDEESDGGVEVTAKSVPVQRVASATPSKLTSAPKSAVSVVDNQEDKNERNQEETHGKSTESKATSPGLPEVNNTVRTDDPIEDRLSSSAESSESDDEASGDAPMSELQSAEAAGISSTSDDEIEVLDSYQDTLAQPPNSAPRMLGEKDLPLFSDFNAKHNITPADTALQRSANFLERELGGAPSGFGQTDDAEAPFIDYVASQDADDLYQSIEDISREVFGSIRDLPDCKPLSNTLDVATEPFVTDFISTALGRKSAELERPLDKTTVLSNIMRGSSPIVYIQPNEMDIGTSIITNDGDEGGEEQDEANEEEQNADDEPLLATQDPVFERYSSNTSSLSTLTPSPTPPETVIENAPADTSNDETDVDDEIDKDVSKSNILTPATEAKKRKLTGITSKHFSPKKSLPRGVNARVKSASKYVEDQAGHDIDNEVEQLSSSDDLSEEPQPLKPKKKKGTGKTSTYFTPTSSPSKPTDNKKTTPLPKTPRRPKGTSICPVPSTDSTYFGLIQEKLWKEPFWLIIAVTFLNKTTGRAAAPIFWNLKELYPTPEALSQADEKALVSMIETLGLQNQRAKRLILISKAWLANPPAKNQRYRTLHYPAKGDGKDTKKDQVVEEDADECEGALEIGHIPGCGSYAYDSWRIFCRDVLRGVAQDYNGRLSGVEDFKPEWQRVVPLDKELRACLRWMWLKEGYVWDPETGKRRDATWQELDAGLIGEMEIADEQERKFAMDAAGVDGDEVKRVGAVVKDESGDDKKDSVSKAAPSKRAAKTSSRKTSIARRELDVESGDEVVVPTVRRSRRNKAGQRF